MAADVKVKKAISMDTYDVFVGGVRIGEVRKKVTKYNLRRSITTTGWYGTLESESGVTRQRVPERGECRTRSDAVEALVRSQEKRAEESFRMAQGLES